MKIEYADYKKIRDALTSLYPMSDRIAQGFIKDQLFAVSQSLKKYCEHPSQTVRMQGENAGKTVCLDCGTTFPKPA